MSCEESNVKRRCMESDGSQSQSSTSTAASNSQPSSGAPIKSFRDLIFAVSGTMPASAIENTDSEQNDGAFSGKRKSVPNVDDCDADSSAGEKCHDADKKEDLCGIVSESDVGITQFISKHDGFSGILKQR